MSNNTINEVKQQIISLVSNLSATEKINLLKAIISDIENNSKINDYVPIQSIKTSNSNELREPAHSQATFERKAFDFTKTETK